MTAFTMPRSAGDGCVLSDRRHGYLSSDKRHLSGRAGSWVAGVLLTVLGLVTRDRYLTARGDDVATQLCRYRATRPSIDCDWFSRLNRRPGEPARPPPHPVDVATACRTRGSPHGVQSRVLLPVYCAPVLRIFPEVDNVEIRFQLSNISWWFAAVS